MTDKITLTQTEENVCEMLKLHKGAENAIKSYELEKYFHVSGSEIREIINSLRVKGFPVCSSGKGYYFAKNKMELRKTIAHLNGRKNSIESAMLGLLQAQRYFGGEIDV